MSLNKIVEIWTNTHTHTPWKRNEHAHDYSNFKWRHIAWYFEAFQSNKYSLDGYIWAILSFFFAFIAVYYNVQLNVCTKQNSSNISYGSFGYLCLFVWRLKYVSISFIFLSLANVPVVFLSFYRRKIAIYCKLLSNTELFSFVRYFPPKTRSLHTKEVTPFICR